MQQGQPPEPHAAARAEVARLVALPPGPDLVAGCDAALSLPMDQTTAIDLAACWLRARSWFDAQELTAVAAIASPTGDPAAWAVSDLAATIHVSEYGIDQKFSLGHRASTCLPASFGALAAGRITLAHLRALDAVTAEAAPELAQAVEAKVLDRAIEREWTPAQLRDAARRALLSLDPEGAAERARRAKVRRSDVKLYRDEDEMSALVATGDAWTNRRLMDEINRRADAMQRAGDDRRLGELRMAALAQALLDPPVGIMPASQPAVPKRAQALVILDLPTLIGLRDSPGELAGHGPITAELARRIAADSSLRLLVLSPVDGKPAGLGRSSYAPSASMRRWLDVRDRTCLFPGCRRRAVYCDADHCVEFDAGGETDCDNCGLLCRKHHNYKTSKAWDLIRHSDDSVTWVSPFGHSFDAAPEPYEPCRPYVDEGPPAPTDEGDNDTATRDPLPTELSTGVTDEEWQRRWDVWPQAG